MGYWLLFDTAAGVGLLFQSLLELQYYIYKQSVHADCRTHLTAGGGGCTGAGGSLRGTPPFFRLCGMAENGKRVFDMTSNVLP